MIWLVLAAVVALVAVILGVCALVAWHEEPRRGGYIDPLTTSRRNAAARVRRDVWWPKGTKR